MDVSQLFRAGVTVDGAPMPAATSTIYGTAVADSHDGTVLVEMDGDAVTQPAQESTTATLPASAFEGGTAALPSEPFPGSVRVYAEQADDDHLLDEEAYQVNGDRLTIEALAGGEPVGVEWATHVAQVFANEDFAGGAVQLEGEPANLSVTEDVGGASTPDWQPVAYELDGTTLTVAGMEPADGRVAATYVRTVEIVTDAGEQVLPDMPAADDVAVFGRTTDAVNPPVEAVVTGWDLAGDLITIPAGYDAYTVIYTMPEAEEWNLSGQTDDEPLPDYDPGWDGGAQDADELEPEAVTVGHVLTYEPDAGTLAVTVDGAPASYTLDVQTVTVTATPAPERVLAVEYDAAQAMELPAAAFANGPVELPSVPNAGTVAVEVGGAPLDPSAFSVDDRALAIPGLVAGVGAYVVEYAEQLPVAAVELPTFPAVHEGDVVQITVVGGVPTVTAVQGAGDSVQATLEDATTLAVDASTAADAAEAAATAAQAIAEATGQYFWSDAQGVHVTQVEREKWGDQSAAEYHTGPDVLLNSAGQLFRQDMVNLLGLVTNPARGMAIFDAVGNTEDNIVGLFTQDGVVVGRASGTHVEVTPYALTLPPVFRVGSSIASQTERTDATDGVEVAATEAGTWTGTYTLGNYYYGSPLPSTPITVTAPWLEWYDAGAGLMHAHQLLLAPHEFRAGVPEVYEWWPGKGGAPITGGAHTVVEYDGHDVITITAQDMGAFVVVGTTYHVSGSIAYTAGHMSAPKLEFGRQDESYFEVSQIGQVRAAGLSTYDVSGSGTDYVTSTSGVFNELEVTDYVVGDLPVGGDVVASNLGRYNINGSIDDVTTPGIYYATTSSTDGPVSGNGGSLIVAAAANRANVVQVFVTNSSIPSMWTRRFNSGTWTSWQQMGDTVAEDAPTLSNATATTFAVRRKNGAATIYVNAMKVSTQLASGSQVQIATLPAGYRPAYTTGIPLTSSTANAARGVWLYVTAGGNVSIYNRSGNALATSANLYCAGTYVL